MKNLNEKLIVLPKKVIRDLDNYYKLTKQALEFGRGKYSWLSAKALHEMKFLYFTTRYAPTNKSLKETYKYCNNYNKRDVEFDIPGSLDEYLLKKFEK